MVVKITATYLGRGFRGHYLLENVEGELKRSHAWLHADYNEIPEEIPIGSRISFQASPHSHKGEVKLSQAREIRVIA